MSKYEIIKGNPDQFTKDIVKRTDENGQVWLILSDLAEHLGLRTSEDLALWIAKGGLSVFTRIDIKARHPKTKNADDPLHFARVKETTSLWILEVERQSI